MAEQLICPRCGAPNAPSSASCYYCGWAPSTAPADNSGAGGSGSGAFAPAGGAAAGGYGAAGGPTQGNTGNTGTGAGNAGTPAASAGGYGSGAYGSGSYGSAGAYGGAGDYGAAAGGYSGGGYGGPGNTEVRPNSGGPPPPPPSAPAAGGAGPSRNRILIIVAAIAGGLLLTVLAVLVIMRFVGPGYGPFAGPAAPPGPASSNPPAGSPTAAPSTPKPSPTPSATPAPDFDGVAAKVKDGVLKVIATGCGNNGSRIGSAFLVDKDTAVASYASLAGSQTVAVFNGSESVPAQVKSADPERGIVVLKLDRSIDGHVFDLDSSKPAAKDPVGLLGVKSGSNRPSLKTTTITDTSKTAKVGSDAVSGLATTELDADDGWAGGPTLAADGKANGMVFAGPGASTVMIAAGSAIKAALSSKDSLPSSDCNDPKGPDVTVIGGKPTKAVEDVLAKYFGGINSGDYRSAYKQLGPHSNNGNYGTYVSGWRSAYDYNIVVHRVSGSGDGSSAKVSFNAITLPGQGPKGHSEATCVRWDMKYTFASSGGRLLIDRVTASPSLC